MTIGAYPASTIKQARDRHEVQPGDVLALIKARADTAVTAERIRVIVQQIQPLPGARAHPEGSPALEYG